MEFNLTDGAQDLLESLREGDGGGKAELSVYPGIDAFSDHAELYFDNAEMLCENPPSPDFAVFAALYCVRHGLELWLKWIVSGSYRSR